MKLRPYDLDSLTRAVCAHMVARGIAVVVVDEGIIQTPDAVVIQIDWADVDNKVPPNALAEVFEQWREHRDGESVRGH
jgi:hypothetical protein